MGLTWRGPLNKVETYCAIKHLHTYLIYGLELSLENCKDYEVPWREFFFSQLSLPPLLSTNCSQHLLSNTQRMFFPYATDRVSKS
jgi:hypothetical protein